MPDWSLLAVFAHPDDETFRPGGTLALLACAGIRVQVLTATRGENGSCGKPPVCSRHALAQVREDELRCACSELGLEAPILLGYEDGQLANALAVEVVYQIQAVLDVIHPQVMISFGPDGISGHSDHIAIGQYAHQSYSGRKNIAAFYTPVVPDSQAREAGMMNLNTMPEERINLSIDISPVWQEKWAAIQCHTTQWSTSPLKNTKKEHLVKFFGIEHFIRFDVRNDAEDFLWIMFSRNSKI